MAGLGPHMRRHIPSAAIAVAAIALISARPAPGYSVLTHEALVDAEWDKVIVPMLLARFPSSTAAELEEAHAYAYGGCVIQDMGYYPFSSHFFSHLTHYV